MIIPPPTEYVVPAVLRSGSYAPLSTDRFLSGPYSNRICSQTLQWPGLRTGHSALPWSVPDHVRFKLYGQP